MPAARQKVEKITEKNNALGKGNAKRNAIQAIRKLEWENPEAAKALGKVAGKEISRELASRSRGFGRSAVVTLLRGLGYRANQDEPAKRGESI